MFSPLQPARMDQDGHAKHALPEPEAGPEDTSPKGYIPVDMRFVLPSLT